MTRLAILADTRHYRRDDDLYVLTRVAAQLEELGSLFESAEACAPLYPGPPPPNFEPYLRGKVQLRPLRGAGGKGLAAKVRLAMRAITWIRPLRAAARSAGLAHLRCPCNVALVALLVVPSKLPCYAMYAGTWDGYPGEPLSYRLQRWLLCHRPNSLVTVYANPDTPLPDHVVPLFSPTHTKEEVIAEAAATATKIDRLAAGERPSPLRVVAVGHLTANKNHATLIRAVAAARDSQLYVELDIAGDGELRAELTQLVNDLGLAAVVRLHGVLPRDAVQALYREAHVNVLISRAEGFGKVVVEGMASGAVPLLSNYPTAGMLAGDGQRGRVIDPVDADAVATALSDLASDPSHLASMARSAQAFAAEHSLEAFRDQLVQLIGARWPHLLSRAPR